MRLKHKIYHKLFGTQYIVMLPRYVSTKPKILRVRRSPLGKFYVMHHNGGNYMFGGMTFLENNGEYHPKIECSPGWEGLTFNELRELREKRS